MATKLSRGDYLSTTSDPDREWVDGALVERNVGTQRHGRMQLILGEYLRQFRESHQIEVFAESRLQVGDRVRIPDVMVLQVPYAKAKTDGGYTFDRRGGPVSG